ncbi:hypothetical protein [Mycobacterium tuberculosis]|uniref:hypothetical protein n=1 Tax=Mycobacterium tuberculosis TaxID=1773 RepID=UPI00272A93AA|nr:hypothetical protein [Mycobacterium tuberculosis]
MLADALRSVTSRPSDRSSVREAQSTRSVVPFQGTPYQYFAEFGFVTGGKRLPSALVWQADGTRLKAPPISISPSSAL